MYAVFIDAFTYEIDYVFEIQTPHCSSLFFVFVCNKEIHLIIFQYFFVEKAQNRIYQWIKILMIQFFYLHSFSCKLSSD